MNRPSVGGLSKLSGTGSYPSGLAPAAIAKCVKCGGLFENTGETKCFRCRTTSKADAVQAAFDAAAGSDPAAAEAAIEAAFRAGSGEAENSARN